MSQKIVIALGGNALGNNPEEQKEAVKVAAESIVNLIATGNNVMIVHGNGPQVGMINLAFSEAHQNNDVIPEMPFVESTAMSQGYIGYHLQNALDNELRKRQLDKEAVTLLTQVVIDKKDPAFQNPTKPVGPFYSQEEADALSKATGDTYIEDSGRGYRKVVPSPFPVTVVEKKSIKAMMDQGIIVISNGGGGIPVVEENNRYEGVDAVIDKDNSAAKIAEEINADILVILTGVPRVAVNYGQPNQEWLQDLSVEQAEAYIAEEQFAPGSMLPKVEASIRFVKSAPEGRKAIITSLENAEQAVINGEGTILHR